MFPFPLPDGAVAYTGYGAMGGENYPQTWLGADIGTNPPPVPQPSEANGAWNIFVMGLPLIPYFGHANMRFLVAQDPAFDTYNFNPFPYRSRIEYLASILDSLNPEISRFLHKGGKLIMKENTCDYHRSTFLGINYFKSLLDEFGENVVDYFVRFYVAAGADHFGENAPSQADLITLLENWVEKGEAPPKNVVAYTVDSTIFNVGASGPMCGYGLYPKYKGWGNVNDAASFTCEPLMERP